MRRPDLRLPAAAIAVFAIFAGLYYWARPVYEFALTWYGIAPFRFPFLDTDAITAAIECYRQGIDVYIANPCDALGRPHVYSPLWLAASVLPVTRAWTMPIGLGLDLAFLLSLAAIPVPAQARDRRIMLAAVFSTMTIYAVERGNNDLFVFLLVLLAGLTLASPAVWNGSSIRRWWGYLLIATAALLKFYPVSALIVSCRERRHAFIAINLLMLSVICVFVAIVKDDLKHTAALIPFGSYYTDLFGAKNLPYGIAHLIYTPSREFIVDFVPPLLLAILCLRALWLAIGLAQRPALHTAFLKLEERARIWLILGSAIITACFFAGQSAGYRGVFFLLVLPGLFGLAQCAEDDQAARLVRQAPWLILFVMWSEAMRHAIVAVGPGWLVIDATFWIAKELAWWRIIATLGGVLLCFVLASPVWRRGSADRAATAEQVAGA